MKVMTFGEIMLRLKTPEYLRILQSDAFEASYGGAESNVAVSLAMFGDEAAYLTKIPDNPVGMAALGEVRRFGVDTSQVLHGGSRLGIYYFEKGTDLRPTNVVYDREYSALAMADAGEFAWGEILEGIDIFYFSGVTPAISTSVEQAVLEALQYCHDHGIQVVCDLNYRSKMWSTEKAQEVMKNLMNYVVLLTTKISSRRLESMLLTEIWPTASIRSTVTGKGWKRFCAGIRTARRWRVF